MSRRNRSEHPFNESPRNSRSSRSKSRKRKRWPWVLLTLGAIVFFLPNMIGWLGLQQKAIDYGLADFNGTVSAESVSLGWLQPIKLTHVSAIDPDGNPIFDIDEITSSKTLFSFLSATDYGQIDIQNPTLFLEMRPNGSNLEDAISKYIQPANDSQQKPNPQSKKASSLAIPKLTVNVAGGQAIISSATSAQTWQIDGLNFVAETSADTAPLIIDMQCNVAQSIINETGQSILQNAGGLVLTGQVDAGSPKLNFSSADISVETQTFPLSLISPVLQRFIGPVSTTGHANGKIQAAWDATSNSITANVENIKLTQFRFAAPELIGSDELFIENTSVQGLVQVSPTTIAAQQFKLDSDIGSVNAEGNFEFNQIMSLATGGHLLDSPFQMDGEIDLARLIRMLPGTLQLHQDLVVNSGTVNFFANSRNENGKPRLVVNLDTANINARRGNQNIVWAKPLRIVGTIRESSGELTLEDFECVSEFLTIRGNANMHNAAFVAKGDLAELMKRVSQFADVPGLRLAGTLDGEFGWQASSNQPNAQTQNGLANLPIQIVGKFEIANPDIEFPNMPRWHQPQMSVQLSAIGQTSTGDQLQIKQGGLQLDIGNERFVAALAQPVANAFTNQNWNANCQITGSLAKWLGHVQNFVDLGEISTADGQVNLICAATLDSKSLRLADIQYEINQLNWDGYDLKIREPKSTGTGVVVYDLASGNISIPEATFSASSMSARGQQLEITFPGNMRIDGNVAFQADVNRVSDWFELSPTADSVFWYGSMAGTVELASNENGIGGRLNSTITDLVAARQIAIEPQLSPPGVTQVSQPQRTWEEVWREPKVGINGDLSMANDFNAIAFQDLMIDSAGLKAKTNGTISELATSMFADLAGTWDPDWQKINTLLAAYTGDMLRFAGHGEQQFAVRGPIFDASASATQPASWVPNSLSAVATLGWDQGEILNLPVGASSFELNLQQGIATLKTDGIPFAGGTVQFAPKIDLRGEQPVLTMEQTRLVNNVELKPETARQWLKYVAPLAADATSAQGNFTFDIAQAEIPLLDPMAMEAQGSIQLHRVVIGAGPTAEQLIGTVKQLRSMLKPDSNNDRDLSTWIQMSEQTVPIVVKNGRVYHDNLDFTHKDISIKTSGSVGLDQTLNMVAEIPIADDWIKDEPWLAGLKGQSLSIPVTGTVAKPILDKRAIQQLSTQLLKQTANSAINKAIGEKITPKVNEYQNRLNDKIGNELNKLQGKFGEKLGGSFLPSGKPATGDASPNTGQQPSLQQQVGEKLEGELLKGIGNLFGQ